MPGPFRPSMLRGVARGLRVVEGEANAAARAKALRASAARRVQPEFTLLEEGREPSTFRGVAPGVEASAAETMAREAGTRHARSRRTLTPAEQAAVDAQLVRIAEYRKRGATFSPEATAKQQKRLDLMTSHADLKRDFRGAVEEDARRNALRRHFQSMTEQEQSAPKGYTPEAWEHELATRGQRMTPEEFANKWQGQAPARDLLDAFEDRFGWRPASEKEARDMLSPEALHELGFPEVP